MTCASDFILDSPSMLALLQTLIIRYSNLEDHGVEIAKVFMTRSGTVQLDYNNAYILFASNAYWPF